MRCCLLAPSAFERDRAAAQVYTNCSICRAEPCSYHYHAAGMGLQAKVLGAAIGEALGGGGAHPDGPSRGPPMAMDRGPSMIEGALPPPMDFED